MPIETYFFLTAFIAVFASFMAALAWVSWYTRDVTPRW